MKEAQRIVSGREKILRNLPRGPQRKVPKWERLKLVHHRCVFIIVSHGENGVVLLLKHIHGSAGGHNKTKLLTKSTWIQSPINHRIYWYTNYHWIDKFFTGKTYGAMDFLARPDMSSEFCCIANTIGEVFLPAPPHTLITALFSYWGTRAGRWWNGFVCERYTDTRIHKYTFALSINFPPTHLAPCVSTMAGVVFGTQSRHFGTLVDDFLWLFPPFLIFWYFIKFSIYCRKICYQLYSSFNSRKYFMKKQNFW